MKKQSYAPMDFARFKSMVDRAKGSCDELRSLESKLSRIYDNSDGAQTYLRRAQKAAGCNQMAEDKCAMENAKEYLIKAADICDENGLIKVSDEIDKLINKIV